MCFNYRSLNKINLKNMYTFPWIDDLLDQLHHEKYFNELDSKYGQHQDQIKEEDTSKITSKMNQGLSEWLVMPFGLSNALTTCIPFMNDVLHPFLDSFVIVMWMTF